MIIDEISYPEAMTRAAEERGLDLARSPLGDFYPELRSLLTQRIDYSLLPQRALSYFGEDHEWWGDFASRSVAELLDRPNVGRLTMVALLSELDRCSREGRLTGRAGSSESDSSADLLTPDMIRTVVDCLSLLGRWSVRPGSREKSLTISEMSGAEPGVLPMDVAQALQRLLSSSFPVQDGVSSLDIMGTIRRSLGDRVTEILVRRLWVQQRVTLEVLASEQGCTREWIRSLQHRGAEDARGLFVSDECLAWAAHDLRTEIGAVTTDAAVRASLSRLGQSLDEPGGRALLWGSGPYREVRPGVWCLADEAWLDQLSAVVTQWSSAPVDDAEVVSVLGGLGVLDVSASHVMANLGRSRRFGDTWFPWGGTVTDKAAVILGVAQVPMTSSAIAEAIGEGHSERATADRLGQDERFVRTSRRGWGLTEWSVPEYLGIAETILDRIDRGGGHADVAALRAELVGTFGVADSSVTLYLNTLAFVVEGGLVRRRTEFDPWPVNTSLASAAGVFRAAGDVVLLVPVTPDLVRGSGRSVPQAAAVALGVGPGSRRLFHHRFGDPIPIGWRTWSTTGPDCGSLRSVVRSLSADEGDHLVLRLQGLPARLDAGLIEAGTGAADALRIILGCTPTRSRLAEAIGSEEALVDVSLRTRGDDLVASWAADAFG